MDGIPPARDTDAEDVVWALQTAEALWKRNERGDAIVWLRRAAQAAGEASDDDRALALAREAAELTEWFAHSSSAALSQPPLTEGSVSGVAIDSLLRSSQVDSVEVMPTMDLQPVSIRVSEAPLEDSLPPPSVDVPPAPALKPSDPVPSAAESHAGMLDPWSDGPEARRAAKGSVAVPPPLPAPAARLESDPTPPASEDGVFTSAPPPKRSVSPPEVKPAPPAKAPRPAKPPPAKPPPAKPPPAKPPPAKPPPAKPPPLVPPPIAETKSQEFTAVAAPPRPRVKPNAPPAQPEAKVQTKLETKPEEPEAPVGPLDLSAVEAFADLPDDSRDSLAKGASLKRYSKGDVIESFALVFVLSGEVHVAATGASSHAATLTANSVLLGRGSLESTVSLRLVGASAKAVLATWDAASVEAAMGSCPWVEEELRKAGDRIQAVAGASLGALGQRLSPDLRAGIIDRLSLRTLEEHETIVTEGVPVPGILLVAVGNVELLASHLVTGQVAAGEFVLPAEALSAGPSPATARAGLGGALLLAGDRKTSQELFATEPLLLELFAGW